MALIKCPECGKEVSDTSYKCPNCGYVLNKPKRGVTGQIAKGLFVTFNVIMLISFISLFAGISNAPTTDDTGAAQATVGVMGTGMLITVWIILGLPLGIMSYITRAKAE